MFGLAWCRLASEPSSEKVDYEAVRKELLTLMDNPSWDDGSLAPVFIRLAWHSSGTYDSADGVVHVQKALLPTDAAASAAVAPNVSEGARSQTPQGAQHRASTSYKAGGALTNQGSTPTLPGMKQAEPPVQVQESGICRRRSHAAATASEASGKPAASMSLAEMVPWASLLDHWGSWYGTASRVPHIVA